jgi:hypothetical protein
MQGGIQMIPNLILGGGPVGILLGAVYGYPVITNEVKPPKGPVYLYDTIATRTLMKKLMLTSLTSREISIGYFFRGKLMDEPTEMSVMSYSLKMKKPAPYVPKTFRYFTIPWSHIFERAISHIPEVILAEASMIDLKNQVIFDGTGSQYRYDNLISTIPAPLFQAVTGNTLPWKLSSIPVILSVENIPQEVGQFSEWEKYDYIYFCDYDDPRIRLTSSGYMERIDYCHSGSNMNRIIGGSITPVKNVKFMGRFARWEEHRLISDDVAEAIGEKISEGVRRKC